MELKESHPNQTLLQETLLLNDIHSAIFRENFINFRTVFYSAMVQNKTQGFSQKLLYYHCNDRRDNFRISLVGLKDP